ncbi:MAG: OmpA family protein [Chitinophagaceae bacterium]|nr:OmpA family protein [Chitinophagaceae bacterium]
MKKGFLYLLLLLCSGSVAHAQQTRAQIPAAYFKNAEKEFDNQRYMYAIPFYRASMKSGRTNDSIALIHLAECYWQMKNYDSSLVYYIEYERKYSPRYSTHRRIAELHAVLGRYGQAAATYKSLLTELPLHNGKMLNERWKGFSAITGFLRDSLDYTIGLLKLNSKQQDFSPQYFQRGMVFVSNRYSKREGERQFGWDGMPYANVYWVRDTAELYLADSIPGRAAYTLNAGIKANDDFTARTSNDNDIINIMRVKGEYKGDIYKLAKFGDDLTTKYNYGPLCFNKAGNKVYFTRNSKKPYGGRYNLEICEASYEQGTWTNIKVMPFVQPAYDFYHPALSDDEKKLFFCSNKPDGFGGSDIWYADLDADADKTLSINLGDGVNTAGDELFPTIADNNLYFSTDGLAGLGGLDVYRSSIDKRGRWTRPVNLGYPINTSFDDFGIIFNGTRNKGYFTSNRLGTDDIYAFSYAPFIMNLHSTVFNKPVMRRLDKAMVIITTIEDSVRIPVDTILTDLTGNFHFPAKPGRDYQLDVTRDGFTSESVTIAAPVKPERDVELNPVLLTPLVQPLPPAEEKDRDGDGVPDSKDRCPDIKGPKENNGCPDIQKRLNELAKMVFFDTDKSDILQKSLKPLNEVVAILLQYPNTTLAIEGHTDSRASAEHNKALSQRRAASVKAYLMSKGLTKSRFTSVVGYGLERPIADNQTEAGRAMNRRVELKAVFVQ